MTFPTLPLLVHLIEDDESHISKANQNCFSMQRKHFKLFEEKRLQIK